MIFIIGKNGRPIALTVRTEHVRKLVEEGRARIIKDCPRTVQIGGSKETDQTQEKSRNRS